jgi:hypothetical protein
MTLNAKPRMDVVKREDKEAKLKAFISDYLLASSAACVAPPWLLIARSAESPVVQALLALAPAIRAAGLTVRTLYPEVAANASDTAALSPVAYAGEVRVLRDLRLLDAHEQLYLDPRTSWVGDCMRREPAKRDAYEYYASDCTETADWCLKAFVRLWPKGEPVTVTPAEPAAEPGPVHDTETCVRPANQVPATMVALTRH